MPSAPAGARSWPAPSLLVALGLLFAGGDPVRLALAVWPPPRWPAGRVRDLVAPVRLAVDPARAHGRPRVRRPPAAALVGGRGDRPSTAGTRLGLTSETLEIDAGNSLHLFGRHDLGADPHEVAAALRAARPATDRRRTRRSGRVSCGGPEETTAASRTSRISAATGDLHQRPPRPRGAYASTDATSAPTTRPPRCPGIEMPGTANVKTRLITRTGMIREMSRRSLRSG